MSDQAFEMDTTGGLGNTVTRIGVICLFASMALIYFGFGTAKFYAYEAEGLVPLVENSPLLGWMYQIFSVRGFSTFLGSLEIIIGLLIVARLISPALSALGGLLSVGLFITTLSLMFTTPGVAQENVGLPALSVAPGQFLLKDVGLFAGSLLILGLSLQAMERKKAALG